MQFATRQSLKRIPYYLVVVALLVWGSVQYMCRCTGKSARVLQSVSVPERLLRTHVGTLAGTYGERNLTRPIALRNAANYIDAAWREQRYEVARFPVRSKKGECWNLEVTRQGKTRPNEIILVGAHYDSVESSPGANDNASGVAALLEISRVFTALAPERSVRFVAFVNEEPPYFETEWQGSRQYAQMARTRGDNIRVMICLETLGYYNDAPGSQKYPKPFQLIYPDRGNFLGFISNFGSRSVMRDGVRAFRAHSEFPVESCATFERIDGVNWSDHAAFWLQGFSAFMVSDTAIYRDPHYHRSTDTPDKLNYPALTRVTEGLCGVVASFAAAQ